MKTAIKEDTITPCPIGVCLSSLLHSEHLFLLEIHRMRFITKEVTEIIQSLTHYKYPQAKSDRFRD